MREESAVISAVCRNKDIHTLFENNVDSMMTHTADVWDFVKEYYSETKQVPELSMIETRFRDFDPYGEGPTIYHVNRLKETFLDDSLRSTVRKAAQMINDNESSRALDLLSSDLSKISRSAAKIRDIDVTDIEDTMFYLEKVREESKNGMTGIKTGILSFDACLPMGIKSGQLGILLAYPAIGKSWMALYMAVQAWKEGKSPLVLSLEMTEQEVRNRILAIIGEGKFSHRAMSAGKVDIAEYSSWATREFEGRPPFRIVSNDGLGEVNPNVIRSKIDQYRPDIVFIDYLQLMVDNGRSDNETVKIKNLSRELKLLAISEQIPVVAIASATPDDATDLESVPQLGQVAWSRQIAYDADWVMAMGRAANSDALECVLRKNRHGFLGDFVMVVDFDKGVFKEVFDPLDS